MKVEPFKIKDLTPIKSEYIQRVLFEFGYKWADSSKNIIFTDEKIIVFRRYFFSDPLITYMNNINDFNKDNTKEITFNEFIKKYGRKSSIVAIFHDDELVSVFDKREVYEKNSEPLQGWKDLIINMDEKIIKLTNKCMEKQIKLTVEQAKSMLGKSVEMDELLKTNFTLEELGLKKALPKSWEELKLIKGYYIRSSDSIIDSINDAYINIHSYNVFKTEKQAESALAMAQLSQLMYVYNEGWSPDFSDRSVMKYIIRAVENEIYLDATSTFNFFLAFKSSEIRDEFLTNFRPLIEKYFML